MKIMVAGVQGDIKVKFTEDCFQIAIQYYLPPYNLQVRVGGLYLLYGLYISQPLISKAKIRVIPEQWQEIMNFQNEVHRQEHLDVDYVFYKLRLMRAFEYCATSTEIFPTEKSSTLEEAGDYEQFKEEESLLYDLFSADVLEQMAAVHQHYHRMKVGMEGEGATKPSKSLDVIQEDLVPSITKAIVHYQDKRRNENTATRKRGVTTDDDDDINDPDYKIYGNEDGLGRSKKKRLKAKAYQNTSTFRRRGRKRVAVKEESTEEEGVSPSKQKKKKANVSKKNIFQEEISEAVQATGDRKLDGEVLSMPVFEVDTSTQKKSSTSLKRNTKQKSKKDKSPTKKESRRKSKDKKKEKDTIDDSSSKANTSSKNKKFESDSSNKNTRIREQRKSSKSVLKETASTLNDVNSPSKEEVIQPACNIEVSPSKGSDIATNVEEAPSKWETVLSKEENSSPVQEINVLKGEVTPPKRDENSEIIKKQGTHSGRKSSGKKLNSIISSLEKKLVNQQAKKLDFDMSEKVSNNDKTEGQRTKAEAVSDPTQDSGESMSTKVVKGKKKGKKVMPTLIPLLPDCKKGSKRKKKS